jgi:hypothetical protein
MPITPEQARKTRTEAAAPAVADLAKRVDNYLGSTRPTFGQEWWFDIRGVPAAVIDETIRLYEAAGWNVRKSHDQRDGSALVFSERAQ